MTKIIYTTILLLTLVSCDQKSRETKNLNTSAIETDQTSNKEPIISFDKKNWDFGTITDGEVVEHTFRFTNTGTSNLVISSASASCGCTIPNWPKEPIAPGEKGEIKVEFNSNGKKDMVTKDITILANTNPVKTILQIKVFVEKKS
ncbi:MAG: DUF1573 domain-containing protein [Bacteroidia bacterium]|nr:DUF1573 domain-containing protein [Bacteroidia bacterium]|tara:strand:- start:13 stop:450 length:438 start_codon:yes stop_codon:yes gene_type:complete